MQFGLLVLVVALAAGSGCKGAEGPTGPAGPPGPQGPIGPVGPPAPAGTTKISLTTVTTSSFTLMTLPTAAGDATHPPSVTVYVTDVPANGVWLEVSDSRSETTPYIGLGYSAGAWNVAIDNMPIGWTIVAVAIY